MNYFLLLCLPFFYPQFQACFNTNVCNWTKQSIKQSDTFPWSVPLFRLLPSFTNTPEIFSLFTVYLLPRVPRAIAGHRQTDPTLCPPISEISTLYPHLTALRSLVGKSRLSFALLDVYQVPLPMRVWHRKWAGEESNWMRKKRWTMNGAARAEASSSFLFLFFCELFSLTPLLSCGQSISDPARPKVKAIPSVLHLPLGPS